MNADYVLEYDVLSRTRDHRLYLLVRVRGKTPPAAMQRQPLNLCVVLDRSSSMVGDKIAYVRDAASALVQRMAAIDHISLVTYSDNVQVILPPTPVIHKDGIIQTIQAVRPMGTTNLSGGWLQGCTLLSESGDHGQINRVLLLTDGLANKGVTEPDRLAALARQKREEGIYTTTMGVGLDFNEDLLVRMASEGGGSFYFIDSPDRAPEMFVEELADLVNVVGQNLRIRLTLERDVQMVRQLNTYRVQAGEGSVTFDLGDLYGDETKLLVLELFIPALYTLGETQVGTLRFDYDELGADSVTHRALELPLIVNAVRDEDLPALPAPDREVARAVLLLRAARAREQAIQYADAGDFKTAADVLRLVADDFAASGLDDPELEAHHNMLREEVMDMELGAQRYDSYFRKSVATKSTHAARAARFDETIALHERLKSSRQAVPRMGQTPTLLTWKREQRRLEDVTRLTIGRNRDNDIVIPEDEVSGYHCQIMRDGDALFLEDLNSTNGTFANGGQVRGRFRLSVGDIVTVGSWLFMFREA
ncbi:MAG: hypothetical protein Kow0077_19350 [Anaerolineae bacterium]